MEESVLFEFWSLTDPRIQQLFESQGGYPIQSIWRKTNKIIYGSRLGIVAVEEAFGCRVVCGDPLPTEGQTAENLLRSFIAWSRLDGITVCGYYFSEEVAMASKLEIYNAGVSRGLPLNEFSLKGYHSRDMRRALNCGRRESFVFSEVASDQKSKLYNHLVQLENIWRSTRPGPKIHFILSQLRKSYIGSEQERWFIVRDKRGSVQAFVTVIPHGPSQGLLYLDQMVQVPGAHKLALDFLLVELAQNLKKEGRSDLWLGLSVFHDVQGDRLLDRIFRICGRWKWLYSSRGLYLYKKKFTTLEKSRYLLLDPKRQWLRQVAALTKVT
ncbi:phosphatidylglycerol lysyltransferase domain-containing protein, partial [Bdellovibrionales bacterium]|nr:phosphatidylglycerol lysyltransferase domain-containing protein [Bdellovibrionales bacterium]